MLQVDRRSRGNGGLRLGSGKSKRDKWEMPHLWMDTSDGKTQVTIEHVRANPPNKARGHGPWSCRVRELCAES